MKFINKFYLDKNFLIFLLSLGIFVFLFFTKDGVIPQYYSYKSQKETIKNMIEQKTIKKLVLEKKIKGLDDNNQDIMAEIYYTYENKFPYPDIKILRVIKI